jgi:hypothetical protein
MGTTTPTAGTTAITVAVGVAPGSAVGGLPQTPEGVPEDVLEESEEEPEMVSEPVPEEVPTKGAMITARTTSPSPPRGASVASSPAPHAAATAGAAASAAVGPEVILGHPTLYTPDYIPLDEAVSMAHKALSQVQCVLHREDERLADKRRCLQLWAAMLKETAVSKRVAARAKQRDFDVQVEAINQRDAESKRALVDAQKLYAVEVVL